MKVEGVRPLNGSRSTAPKITDRGNGVTQAAKISQQRVINKKYLYDNSSYTGFTQNADCRCTLNNRLMTRSLISVGNAGKLAPQNLNRPSPTPYPTPSSPRDIWQPPARVVTRQTPPLPPQKKGKCLLQYINPFSNTPTFMSRIKWTFLFCVCPHSAVAVVEYSIIGQSAYNLQRAAYHAQVVK